MINALPAQSLSPRYLLAPFGPAAVITRGTHWLNCKSKAWDSIPTPLGNWPNCGYGPDSNYRTAACCTRLGFSRTRRWPRSMLALPLARRIGYRRSSRVTVEIQMSVGDDPQPARAGTIRVMRVAPWSMSVARPVCVRWRPPVTWPKRHQSLKTRHTGHRDGDRRAARHCCRGVRRGEAVGCGRPSRSVRRGQQVRCTLSPELRLSSPTRRRP